MIREYFDELEMKRKQQELKAITRETGKPHVLGFDKKIVPLDGYTGGLYAARSEVNNYKGNIFLVFHLGGYKDD